MKINKVTVIALLVILLLIVVYSFKKQISSQYIFSMSLNVDEVKTYIEEKNNMEIVGETWGKNISFMQIDGYTNGERKKVAVLYHCNILCKLYAVGISNEGNWEIVYGENMDTSWIEDWGNK